MGTSDSYFYLLEPAVDSVLRRLCYKQTIISFQYGKTNKYKLYILFHVTTTKNKFWNDDEIMLKSFWTSHSQMTNRTKASILEFNW